MPLPLAAAAPFALAAGTGVVSAVAGHETTKHLEERDAQQAENQPTENKEPQSKAEF